MRAKSMKMGGVESFEHVQKPATAIQDHVSSPNSIYKVRQACTFGVERLKFDFTLQVCCENYTQKGRLSINCPCADFCTGLSF